MCPDGQMPLTRENFSTTERSSSKIILAFLYVKWKSLTRSRKKRPDNFSGEKFPRTPARQPA